MSYGGFPSIFYSKEPLPTKTVLIVDEDSDRKTPKINWSTCVIDLEERNLASGGKQNTLTPYYDNDEGLLDCMDIEDNYEILPTKSGKFITSFHVPSALIPVIVGPKGKVLRQLQDMTQTLIKIPRINEKGVPIKITGRSERSIVSARNQITMLILAKREKFTSTHFISVPLSSRTIETNFEKFKREILNDSSTRGIDESVFQNPKKLHMTIQVLTLLDELEIENAKYLLADNLSNILSTILPKKCYEFKLQGVEIMNDDPSEVDVLYAKVQMTNEGDIENFQEVADQISHMFFKNGYVRREFDHVKLHVTLMNSLFRKDEGQKRTTFDASFIMEKYADYNFGNAIFRSIDLSIRFSTGKNGYYDSVVSIALPS